MLVGHMTHYVWDLPLRLFHWLLALSMAAVYVTGKLGGLWLYWHVQVGVFILALLTFRIVWGFVGSTYARFHNFIPTPSRLHAYLASTKSGIGHSPLAGIAIVAMLTCVLSQAGAGLFASNDELDFHGPLYDLVSPTWSDRLTHWHHAGVTILLMLIGLHLFVIGYYTGIKRHSLILPMLTGKTTLPDNASVTPSQGGGTGAFLLAFSLAGFVYWCIASGALLRWLSSHVAVAN